MLEERRKTGVYASCEYHEESLLDVAKWLEKHDQLITVPIDPALLHTTVVYSRNDFQVPAEGIENFNSNMHEFRFFPTGLAILGRQDEEKRALVLLLDAEPLVILHDYLKENGASHGFDDYIPHLTVSYDVPADFDHSVIQLPNFSLRPKKINFEPLDLNWCVQDDENGI